MARVLVTGCNGFVGRVLVDRLVAAGDEVYGIDRVAPEVSFAGENCVSGDITDADVVVSVMDSCQPERIIHLAAQSSVHRSFDEPYETIVTNTAPTLHILNYMKDRGSTTRLLAIGSADEYGAIDPKSLPVAESHAVNPSNPYALAKSIQNQCCRGFHQLYGANVVITRSFNHTGAGQRDAFVLPSFARQVSEIKLGRREPSLKVGNLDVRRDFLDVRDVCAAYSALLERGAPGETYNVCSGTAPTVRDLLDRLVELAGVEVSIEVDPDRLRPADTPELRGDPSKIRDATGWKPAIGMEETLQSLLDYWEDRVRNQGD